MKMRSDEAVIIKDLKRNYTNNFNTQSILYL